MIRTPFVGFQYGSTYTSSTMLGLSVIGKTMGIPEPKIETVEIPGRNGVLDLTDCLTGSALMKDYELEFNFMFDARNEATVKTNLTSICALNGKYCTVTFVGLASFQCQGRVIVKNFRTENHLWLIDIEVKCFTPIDANGGMGYI